MQRGPSWSAPPADLARPSHLCPWSQCLCLGSGAFVRVLFPCLALPAPAHLGRTPAARRTLALLGADQCRTGAASQPSVQPIC